MSVNPISIPVVLLLDFKTHRPKDDEFEVLM